MANLRCITSVTTPFKVFSAFGAVQKIAIFEKNGGTQALIQYPGMSSRFLVMSNPHVCYAGLLVMPFMWCARLFSYFGTPMVCLK